ncbi:MAG: hypothetical protein IPK03_13795 [Bacteroidetes bacterium]|nr:hypothetical protein [Bacteroidota bacterium]
MKFFYTCFASLSFSMLFAQEEKQLKIAEFGRVKVYKVIEDIKSFEKAYLRLDTLLMKQDSSQLMANFETRNFQLGADTKKPSNNLCANSDKGQHIHFILDNEPYTALYTGNNIFKSTPGHHVLLAFLARSYHQSLKLPNTFLVKEYTIGKAEDDFKEKKAHLFYSRPKGTYVDVDTASILIDYFLLNTVLSPKGNKVQIELDSDIKFTVDSWTPLAVNGLNVGEHQLKLTLVDKKGLPINSKFNGVTRKFILANSPK